MLSKLISINNSCGEKPEAFHLTMRDSFTCDGGLTRKPVGHEVYRNSLDIIEPHD